MSNPVNHHYVAQHVLRRFCDTDGFLWTYDKQKKRIYRGPPRSQACAKHYYSFRGKDGGRTAVIELTFLRDIDGDGCVSIERLLRREQLENDQAIHFMRFAAAQMIRVEPYFQRLDALLTPLLQESARRMFKYDENFKKGLGESLRDNPSTSEKDIEGLLASLSRGEMTVKANRGYLVSMFLQNLDTVTKDFCKMNWSFLRGEADASEGFLLSDNPLVLSDVGEGPPQPLGTRNPNIEVTMPLSPSTVALARWDDGVGYGTLDADYVTGINQRTIEQAYRFVYAPYRSDELLERVVASSGKQARTRLVRLKHGKATVFMSVYAN